MMHDKGLSTNIDWRDKDAYGNSLERQAASEDAAPAQVERAVPHPRLQGAQPQASAGRDRPHGQRPRPAENVRETASVIYRRALDENLLPGRSIEGVSTASVYAAARQAGVPRSLDGSRTSPGSRSPRSHGPTATSSANSAWRSPRRIQRATSRALPPRSACPTRPNTAPGAAPERQGAGRPLR